MNVQPETEQLVTLRDARFGWRACICELLDNSLDAGATHITMRWEGQQRFKFADDGRGLPATAEGMERLFIQGRHVAHHGVSRRSGQYGIGFKAATGWLWGTVMVVSRQNGLAGSVTADWQRWVDSHAWQLPDPDVSPGQGQGLFIQCDRILRRPPTDIGELIEDLSFLFNPALKRGAVVESICHGKTRRWAPIAGPTRTDVVESHFQIAGKGVRLSVGLVPADVPNPRCGLHYYRAHRLIKAGSTLGCGRVNPSRIFGWVELAHEWYLSPLKDEITDPAVDQLEQQVEATIRPVLDKAGTLAESLHLQALESELSARLTDRLQTLARTEKAQRGPRQHQSGTVSPTHSGRRHQRAAHTQPGESLLDKAKRGGVKVVFVEMPLASGIGTVDTQPLCVKMNTAHPQVQRVLQRRHDVIGGGFQLAVALLAFRAAVDKQIQQEQFPFMRNLDDEHNAFAVALGEFMSGLDD